MTHPNENEARTYRWNGVPYEQMSHADLLAALTEATDIAVGAKAFMADLKRRADEAEAELARVREVNVALKSALAAAIQHLTKPLIESVRSLADEISSLPTPPERA